MERHPRAIQGIILGDSGYPIREWLITPFHAPQNAEEENFNNAHIATRNIIERCFGVLKRRFYSLNIGFRLEPDTSCKAIYACLVLHNIAIAMKVPLLEDVDQGMPEDDMPAIRYVANGLENAPERARTEAGKAVRRQIANTFFG
ncbi:nuclease HARBI1 [Elysia marginata]|uniref:Nuclease HARBI1 n=1 Tax=Elysia marginata TaxID=1093978 RepID=A0AAV4FR15_9GAST|nr:nuclease HARBI1 [Elysia marginata]